MPAKLVNLIGMRFGLLVVFSRADSNAARQACWNCICDCDANVVVRGTDLTTCAKRKCSPDCKYKPERVMGRLVPIRVVKE